MSFRDSLFDAIRDIFDKDDKTVVLTNDMGAMGYTALSQAYPDRTCNVGIAEQNLVSVAAGLSQAGYHVFAFGIASHVAYRCLEQIKLDLCASNARVTLIGFGPGLSYGQDGPTHHSTEDVAILRALPNLQILNPSDYEHAKSCVHMAYESRRPSYIRLERDDTAAVLTSVGDHPGIRTIHDKGDIAIFASGITVHTAAEAIARSGISARLYDVYRLDHIAPDVLAACLHGVQHALTIEESVPVGGLGSVLATTIVAQGLNTTLRTHALPHTFLHGSSPRTWAQSEYGLDANAIIASLQETTQASQS